MKKENKMLVSVEITTGAICIGIMPVRIDSGKQLALADMFRAECIATKIVNNEKMCEMDFQALIGKNHWVPEYRIADFTFGGVMVNNPKFDPIRIDKEDESWLKKVLKPTPKKRIIKGQP
jgi:hypothetical protein